MNSYFDAIEDMLLSAASYYWVPTGNLVVELIQRLQTLDLYTPKLPRLD